MHLTYTALSSCRHALILRKAEIALRQTKTIPTLVKLKECVYMCMCAHFITRHLMFTNPPTDAHPSNLFCHVQRYKP